MTEVITQCRLALPKPIDTPQGQITSLRVVCLGANNFRYYLDIPNGTGLPETSFPVNREAAVATFRGNASPLVRGIK